MGATLRVAHQGGDRFNIEIRGHTVSVDQPVVDGGEDTAPTPTELFVAGLASCVAFYARRFLARHELPVEGLEVAADFTMSTGPARVGTVDLVIRVPAGVPAERLDALLAVASHCTVHNSLGQPPVVRFTLEEAT